MTCTNTYDRGEFPPFSTIEIISSGLPAGDVVVRLWDGRVVQTQTVTTAGGAASITDTGFLQPGTTYRATIYTDGDPTDQHTETIDSVEYDCFKFKVLQYAG